MLFPLIQGRRFRCALLGATNLGGKDERPDELGALYDLLSDDRIETVFLTGGAVVDGTPLNTEIAILAKHWPRVAGVTTYYPCAATIRGMAAAGREDWQFLPPAIYLPSPNGRVACTFAYEPDTLSYAQACKAPLVSNSVDSLVLYAGSHCKEGEVEHRGNTWFLRSGAFSSPPGTTMPVTASYLRLRVELDGRIRPTDHILTTFRF